ncbi:hypothetical protein ACP6PL_03840 [Dapis sp. BLCC M126]|uniref:hypothetical protein n=1 Tax=Dapis sp. BLCC M126 TaxID=3400189 RepID=UPI003CEECED1
MLSLTVGEIVQKLYLELDSFGSGIIKGGASNYHDQLGHVIAAVFLTNWPREYSFISSPVVFSTQTLVAEQIAELVQRMIVRCSPGSIRNHKLLYSGSLNQKKITPIQDNVCSKLNDHQCQMSVPSPNGNKLSKNEALSWVFLFAIEDLHLFAKYKIGKIIDGLDTSLANNFKIREKLFDSSTSFNKFKEQVAQLMYYMAANPEVLEETKDYRKYLMENCLSLMSLEDYSSCMNPIIGKYLSDEELSDFYDTFIEYFDDLDERGISDFGKPFSCLTIEQLDTLPISYFLPSQEIPFKLLFKDELPQATDNWVGITKYEARRDIYLIEDILPPYSLKHQGTKGDNQ